MKFFSSGGAAVVLGGEPRANLLPPEVRQKEAARTTFRLFGFGAIAVVVIMIGVYVFSAVYATGAASDLAAAQSRTNALAKEKATYAPVTTTANLIKAVEVARTNGTSTEILWSAMYDQVASRLPAGVSIVSGTISGRLPWQPVLLPAGPLRAARVGTMGFVISGRNLIDGASLMRSLSTITGFADATIDQSSLTSGVYQTTFTLNLSSAALSGRFQPAAAATAAPATPAAAQGASK